ncbi:MAG TPA: tyrosine-protein phosphatase [Candidatus Acidoferrum sp.]|nr:tyrosine-protein phosphatase [Candidatus Acidoferrum sp.]
MKFSRAQILALFLSSLLASGCARSARSSNPAHSSSGPPFAEKIELSGVSYVGKVNDFLYRGSQPNERGIEQLKKIGITTIVDLRGERQGTVETERKRAEEHGMRLVNIRASGWSPPKDEELVQFFSLLQKRPKERIYIHCWLGNDRTGVFIAAYRIAFEHWSADRALEEMYVFRFKGFWHPSMKTYIRNFPSHFAESPAFAPFRGAPSPQR